MFSILAYANNAQYFHYIEETLSTNERIEWPAIVP